MKRVPTTAHWDLIEYLLPAHFNEASTYYPPIEI